MIDIKFKCIDNTKTNSKLTKGKIYNPNFICESPIAIETKQGTKKVPALYLFTDGGTAEWVELERFKRVGQ
jgi:hypothetical protein